MRFSPTAPRSNPSIAARLALLAGIAAVFIALVVSPALAADETMPLGAVDPGMVGYAKTVTTGTVVTTFTVEVIDVLYNDSTLEGSLILFRASGPVIDETAGGVVPGMSGSPIYLTDPADGHEKVAGAISYGFDLAEPTLALATPIEEMLSLLTLPGMSPSLPTPARFVTSTGGPVNLGGARVLNSAVIANSGAEPGPGTLTLRPLSGLLTMSGVDSRSRIFRQMKGVLEARGFTVTSVPGGVSHADASGATIEPGASLGAALMTGDATIAGVGAVTYVDNDKVLGFGHPMLWAGPTDLPLTTAYVHAVFPAIRGGFGFKLASALETTGSLLQDRMKGVAGRLGRMPGETTLTARATNLDTGRTTVKQMKIPRVLMGDPNYAWSLADVGLLVANDSVFDAIRSGTADTTFTIKATALDGEHFTLTFDNKLFDSSDISYSTDMDLILGIDALVANEYEPVFIDSIESSTSITSERRTATITDVSILGRRIVPGGVLRVRTFFTPYGSHVRQSIDTTLLVPKRFYPGYARVTASASSGLYEDYEMYEYWGEELPYAYSDEEPDGVAQIVRDFQEQPHNNEVEVRVSDYYWYGTSASKTIKTDWVTYGYQSKRPSSIRLYRTPSTVTYNSSARFYGYVFPRLSRPSVELWMKSSESTETTLVATFNGTTSGTYSRSYPPTTTSTFYTRFKGSSSLMDSYSTRYAVYVKGRLGLTVPSHIRRGHAGALAGYLRPVHAGNVTIQRYVSGRWRTFKTVTLDVDGNWTWNWTPSRTGYYTLRTYWPGDGGHKASTSAVRTIHVY